MTIAILTPLSLEYQAIRRHLADIQTGMHEKTLYETGQFRGLHHIYKVIIRETGSKNNIVALAAERAIRLFNPSLVFLAGIAGGVKDVKVGDVVVGTKAYGYESGKETTGGPMSRPDVLPYDTALIETARLISRSGAWRRRTTGGAIGAQVFFGPIASGDKVIATSDSPLYRYLKLHYNDTLALEMESIGFATAILNHSSVHALNIRGISDLLDHKSEDYQQLAAEHAAAFLFELLYQSDWKVQAETVSAEQSKPQTFMKDVKNSIIGGNISIGGNLHIGDTSASEPIREEASIKITLQREVAKGHISESVQQLIAYTSIHAPALKREAVLLSHRREQLAKKIRMGTISNADATLERNQITAALLELIEKLS